jgi:hypothetical protein
MKYILIMMLFCSSLSAQITVMQFNADWNNANTVEWFEKLEDCELKKICIVEEPKLQDKHKIIIVPTIIVFKDGEEIKRYQADLSFKLLATRKEIQSYINDQILSDF